MKTHFQPAVPSRRPGGRALHSPSISPSPSLPAGSWRLPAALVAAAWLAGLGAQADSLVPLGFLQDSIPYNLQSQRGMPISSVTNTPPGSDGRMTLVNESFGSYNPPTTNQFQNFLALGAGPGLVLADWQTRSNSPYLQGSNSFSDVVATQMQLPLARDREDNILIILRRVQVGMPYLSRSESVV